MASDARLWFERFGRCGPQPRGFLQANLQRERVGHAGLPRGRKRRHVKIFASDLLARHSDHLPRVGKPESGGTCLQRVASLKKWATAWH